MNTHADKTLINKSQTVTNRLPKLQSKSESTFQFVDNRPEAIAQRKLQEAISNSPRVQQLKAYHEMANNSPQVSQLRALQDRANNSPQFSQTAQLQAMADNHSAQQKQQPIQKKKNNTGLPDNLKTGMENLSGMSLDDVKVHRNSDKPAQLQAHAYAQGTDIHLGPGQEKHLPHEAWHVVQQKQGRVQPTMQMMGKVNVNDDAGLEKEADVIGAKAMSTGTPNSIALSDLATNAQTTLQRVVEEEQMDTFFNKQAAKTKDELADVSKGGIKERKPNNLNRDKKSKKLMQNKISRQIVDSREGFGIREVEEKDVKTKLMNPGVGADFTPESLEEFATNGGPQEEFTKIMNILQIYGKINIAKPKEAASIKRKIEDDYSKEEDKDAGKSGIQRMVDVVRGTIYAMDFPSLLEIFEKIKENFKDTKTLDSLVIKVKNNFASHDKTANRDMNITVQLPESKMYCEIQIHLDSLNKNKDRRYKYLDEDGKELTDPKEIEDKKKEGKITKEPIKDANDIKKWTFHSHGYYEAIRLIKTNEAMENHELIDSYNMALASIKHSDKKETGENTTLKEGELYNFIESEAKNMLGKNPNFKKLKIKKNDVKLYYLKKLYALKDALDTLQTRQNQSILLNEIMKTGIKEKD